MVANTSAKQQITLSTMAVDGSLLVANARAGLGRSQEDNQMPITKPSPVERDIRETGLKSSWKVTSKT